MLAALNGHKEVVEALINAKANVEATENVRGVRVGRGGEGERMGEEGCDR